jgi:predicted nucleic acid-binding protein
MDRTSAAVCIQHRVPLLSNDKTFDEIGGLEVMHW